MSEPLAYHISWTTYGSWLPGDERGWVEDDVPGIQAPDAPRREEARQGLADQPLLLEQEQRAIVEQTIRAHCEFRQWRLHAVNARTNHIHVVVSADRAPEEVMNQFKAWCSRRLNEQARTPKARWWTTHGSTKWINDEDYFRNAVQYVAEGQ